MIEDDSPMKQRGHAPWFLGIDQEHGNGPVTVDDDPLENAVQLIASKMGLDADNVMKIIMMDGGPVDIQEAVDGQMPPDWKALNDLHIPGAKDDGAKLPVRSLLLEYFPRALMEVAKVSAFGAKKYTPRGWETVDNGVERYGDAGLRHVLMAMIDGPTDPETGLPHQAHEAWNALARLELMLREEEK